MFPSLNVAHTLRAGRLIALCALALIPLTGLFAAGPATSAAPGPQIGVIDLDKVMTEYRGAQEAQMRLEKFRTEREQLFSNMQLGMGLPKKDFDIYEQDVSANGKLDEKHLKEQQTLAKKNMEERQTLKDKKSETLTDADKARLEQLDKDVQDESDALKSVYDEWSKQMDTELNGYLKILNDAMDKPLLKCPRPKWEKMR